MAIQVGELLIKMGADVAQLRTDMAEGKRVVTQAMADINQAVGLARSAFIALTGVASAGAFVGMVRGIVEAKAKLYDLSLQTGATVEALSALLRVGEFSGTAGDKIAGAMNKLSRGLTGVDEDSKGAVQGLKALGLNFQEFTALSPDQKMLTVAKAMETFKGEEEKAQVAMLLFGKAGAELVPFLKELATTTKLTATETTASALQAKEFEDNLVALRLSGVEWRKEIVTQLLPALIAVSAQLQTMREDGEKSNLFADGVRIAFEAIAVLGANVAFVLKAVGREFASIGAQVAALARGDFEGFTAISDAVKKDGERARAELDAFERRVMGIKESLNELPTGDFARMDRLSQRPQLKVPSAGGDAKVTEIQRIIAATREKLAMEQLEDQVGRKLTEGEKAAVDIMVKLRDGKLEATVAERKLLAAVLEQRLARERLNDLNEQERKDEQERIAARDKLIVSVQREADAIRQHTAAQEDANAEIGLSATQLRELEIARTLDAAATVRQKIAAIESIPGSEALVAQYRAQVEALDALANAKARGLTQTERLAADPFAGARRGLEDYRREIANVNESAYQLVKGTASRLEDALTDFFTTGKFGARQFVSQLLGEFARLAVVRPMLNSLLGSGFGQGLTSFFGGLLNGGGSSTFTGSGAVGPGISIPASFTPTLAVAPQAALQRESASGLTLQQTVNFYGGVTRNELSAGMATATQQAVATIADSQRRGGEFATA